jgi:hypothetical protein
MKIRLLQLFIELSLLNNDNLIYDDNGMMSLDIEDKFMSEAKKKKQKGLWANMRARRKSGKPRLKPGQKGYPKTLDV